MTLFDPALQRPPASTSPAISAAALSEQISALPKLWRTGEEPIPYFTPHWISDQREICDVAERIRSSPLVVLDTETTDFLELDGSSKAAILQTLAWIQIGIPFHRDVSAGRRADGDAYLIPVWKFTGNDNSKERELLAPLKEVLESADRQLIIQYAPFESGQFERSGIDISKSRVVDTKAMVREYLQPLIQNGVIPGSSLKTVYDFLCGGTMPEEAKSLKGSRWDQDPSEQQRNYLRLDAEIPLHQSAALAQLQKHFGLIMPGDILWQGAPYKESQFVPWRLQQDPLPFWAPT